MIQHNVANFMGKRKIEPPIWWGFKRISDLAPVYMHQV